MIISRRSVILASVATLAGIEPSVADDNWFSKGKSLLKGLGFDGSSPGPAGSISLSDATLGLKETLRVASGRVVNQVGVRDGYFLDNIIHVPLPGFLKTTRKFLAPIGASGQLDDLELRLNRGAEKAAPYAKDIFWQSISSMTFNDAMGILNGPETAATQYFRGKMTPPLTTAFRPIMERQLGEAGAIKSFDNTVNRYEGIPFAPSLGSSAKGKLIDHGVSYALGGIFHYLGKEEAAIRNNPAKRTTKILRKIYG